MDTMGDKNIDLEATELRLGLPGTSLKQITARSKKRPLDELSEGSSSNDGHHIECSAPPPSK